MKPEKLNGVTPQLIETKFNKVKNDLLEELEAEKELMVFEICAALSMPQDKVDEITADLRRYRERWQD